MNEVPENITQRLETLRKIEAIMEEFDWEYDDRQYALEKIDQAISDLYH